MSWEKFVSKKLIGKGTFGKVYKVTDEKGVIGALKVIDQQYHKFRVQFKSAFEITRKINDINYVKALHWLSDKDVSWVMEYVDGKTISALKFSDGFNLDEIMKVMIQVCNGLMALHSRNIIHRDLKPQNILLNSNNIVKITDFDFIKIEHTGKGTSQFVGTPIYASPEHFLSTYELDIRSDLYSVGVILYELVTGKLPIEGRDAKEIGDKHRLKPIILPTKINPLIPEGVERIITGLLEKNPKDRYQHTHTVAVDLYQELQNKKGVNIKEDIPYLLKPRFVNRVISLKTLNELSDELKRKNGKVVLVLGESGIGKSKLIQQFHHYLQFHDIDFYYSVCKPVEYSFEPLSSIFEEILSAKTETEMLQYFGKFGWDLVKFGILAEKEWMDKIEKPVELSGKDAEIRLFSAMTSFIQKAAAKPLVICIDDLQWADEVILKWLIYAERNLKNFPVLIVGLHRTEQLIEDSLIFKIENLIRIRIKNLKSIDVTDMIRSMLGKKSSDRELDNFIKSIISHTKGNPLFIREILYYLHEKGKITIENNKWKYPKDVEIKDLPSDIHRIILERIHELNKEALLTMQTASVIGKKFGFGMLLNMTKKNDNKLLDDLIDCREVSLIEESGNDYIFIHDKVREVLENEIKEKYPSFWKELHLKAGEFLEEKYSLNLDEVLDELANHFYFAEQHEKSAKYLEMAGDKAKNNFLNEKALEHFEKLVKILEKEFANTSKNDIRFDQMQKKLYDAYFNKGRSFYQIGRMEDALSDYLSAKKILEQMNDKQNLVEILHHIGWCYQHKGDHDNALYYFEKELKIVDKMDSKNTLAKIFTSIACVYLYQGEIEKQFEYNSRSLAILQDLDDDELLKAVYSNLGSGYRLQGNYKEALEYYHKSLKISEKSKILQGYNFKWGDSVLFGNFGWVQRELGNYDEAIKYYKKAMKISDEVGDKGGFAGLSLNIGTIYYYKKKYVKALVYVDRAIKIQEEYKLSNDLYFSLALKIDVLFDQKRYSEIQKIYEALLKCLPNNLKSAAFNSKVIGARISFFTQKEEKHKIEKGIKPLKKMLREEKEEDQIAELNGELTIMNYELNREKIADRHKKKAVEFYKKINKKTPRIEYKNKIEKLEKLN